MKEHKQTNFWSYYLLLFGQDDLDNLLIETVFVILNHGNGTLGLFGRYATTGAKQREEHKRCNLYRLSSLKQYN